MRIALGSELIVAKSQSSDDMMKVRVMEEGFNYQRCSADIKIHNIANSCFSSKARVGA